MRRISALVQRGIMSPSPFSVAMMKTRHSASATSGTSEREQSAPAGGADVPDLRFTASVAGDGETEFEIDASHVKEAVLLSEVATIDELEKQFMEKYAGAGASSEVVAPPETTKTGLLRRPRERIEPDKVLPVGKEEEAMILFQKYAHNRRQEGPFMGSELRDVPKEVVEFRKRREIERVLPFEETYMANETSFRRLPEGARLPRESELRALYPQNTSMDYELCEAPCVDFDARGIDISPQPILYCRWVPPNYDPNKTYCTIIVLPDGRGFPTDFDDMCGNFWQRPANMKGLIDNNCILLAPVINMRSISVSMEHVVVRFIDWVTENFKCENGKPHLIGKGNGAALALRTSVTVPNIVHSVIALCGKLQFPLRADDRIKEMMPRLNGTYCLIYLPGGMFKPSMTYRFKGFADFMKVRPAVRMIHYDLVRDLQLYYAINPIEFWNYIAFFRQYHSTAVTDGGRYYHTYKEWFTPDDKKETVNADSKPGEDPKTHWH